MNFRSLQVQRGSFPPKLIVSPSQFDVDHGSSNPAYVVKLMTRLGLFKDVDDLDALQSKLRLEFSKKEEEEAQQLVNIPPTDIPNR